MRTSVLSGIYLGIPWQKQNMLCLSSRLKHIGTALGIPPKLGTIEVLKHQGFNMTIPPEPGYPAKKGEFLDGLAGWHPIWKKFVYMFFRSSRRSRPYFVFRLRMYHHVACVNHPFCQAKMCMCSSKWVTAQYFFVRFGGTPYKKNSSSWGKPNNQPSLIRVYYLANPYSIWDDATWPLNGWLLGRLLILYVALFFIVVRFTITIIIWQQT